ncbi:MAG: flagellar filament capping protein FliD, partial [Planctomycetaceae bacterium]
LNQRYRNEASSIAGSAPGGGDVSLGSVRIVDSAGNEDLIEITSAVKNIGDVLQRINASSALQVRAELNDTGDGFVLVDEAGGSGTLRVEDVDADTAADLRILGDGVAGSDGKQRISSRVATVVDVIAGDTLDDVVAKINAAAGFASASVFDDGSGFNSQRLVVNGTETGASGRLSISDPAGLFAFNVTSNARDALLRVGSDPNTGFLRSSPDDTFVQAVAGINIEVLNVAAAPARVRVSRDDSRTEQALRDFVKGFNAYVKAADDATRFNLETEERGILQGNGTVLRTRFRLDNLVSRRIDGFGEITSLRDLGIQTRTDGTLEFDAKRLEAALSRDRSAVESFLSDETGGFSKAAADVLKSLTDVETGAFFLEENSLQTSITSLNDRIETLDNILLRRRDELIRQFAQMENVLASMNSQQLAISAIRPLSINPAPTGVF